MPYIRQLGCLILSQCVDAAVVPNVDSLDFEVFYGKMWTFPIYGFTYFELVFEDSSSHNDTYYIGQNTCTNNAV